MLVSRHTQNLIFGEKIRILGNGAEIVKPESIKILHPFLDEYKFTVIKSNIC